MAINLNTVDGLWQIPLREDSIYMVDHGIITGKENYGGPVVTSSGLRFIAASSDQKIRTFYKETGEELWERDLPFSGFSTPLTYMVDGVQYLVISCGGTKLGLPRCDKIVAFKLKN